MSVELTEAEKALLPYMTNDLYEKNHSVIATLFPVRHIVGQRLVDNGLLTSTEYLEICSSPENVAGSRLICSLNRKGDDSMATFYKVLASAKGERGVDSILRCLEAAAERKRKESGYDSNLEESLPPAIGNCNCDSKVDVAIKHILELEGQFRQLSSTVAELEKSIHRHMEQQDHMMQALFVHLTGYPGSHRTSTSNLSFMTAPSMASRSNSSGSSGSSDYWGPPNGQLQAGSIEIPMDTAITNRRRLSLPAILNRPPLPGNQLANNQASGNGNLLGIPEESTGHNQLHTAEMAQSPVPSAEEHERQQLQVMMTDKEEPARQRKYATVVVKPFKVIATVYRRLSRSGRGGE